MNLHIFLDEKFVDPFIGKCRELSLTQNKFVINTESTSLKRVSSNVDFAPIGSKSFHDKIGSTNSYKNVFIHYLNIGAYRWILFNRFNSLNWMVWGSDLYQLPFINNDVLLPLTKQFLESNRLIDRTKQQSGWYKLKYKIVTPFVYSKVDAIGTWITPEYDFAKTHLPFLGKNPKHLLFRYPLNINWSEVKNIAGDVRSPVKQNPHFMLGNSGTYSNNHLDAIEAYGKLPYTFTLPLSYGDSKYINRLDDHIKTYKNFVSLRQFLSFKEYVEILNKHDGIIINSLRPQAVGNIWLAMILGKMIFMNSKNFLFDYFRSFGFDIFPIEALDNYKNCLEAFDSRGNISQMDVKFSDDALNAMYLTLFK
jgi:dTDP-N-acetylfucosamine:lipid II N-acetylfucosaminyltransferase